MPSPCGHFRWVTPQWFNLLTFKFLHSLRAQWEDALVAKDHCDLTWQHGFMLLAVSKAFVEQCSKHTCPVQYNVKLCIFKTLSFFLLIKVWACILEVWIWHREGPVRSLLRILGMWRGRVPTLHLRLYFSSTPCSKTNLNFLKEEISIVTSAWKLFVYSVLP